MLIPVATDVWRIEGAPRRFPGGLRMPLGATVIRLPDRTLAIYSPVAFDVATATAIEAEGQVAHLVAPNLLHHMYLPLAMARWPKATVHAPKKLAAKRAELASFRALETDRDPTWRDAIDVEIVGGAPLIGEAVLFHRASGTLVCADFLFHVTEPANFRSRMILAMMGVGGKRLAQSRVWRFGVSDVEAARRSIDKILEWPIARVAVAHGGPKEIDATGLARIVTRAYRGKPALALR